MTIRDEYFKTLDRVTNRLNEMADDNDRLIKENDRVIGLMTKTDDASSRAETRPYWS